ncbi:tripartite tricarboxylate transporter TctB family protein [Aeromicrobium sp. CF4.19]|uniref:tripartite tricarboxylate transporter TctB family protein n=1 Tax=Aeromicrobium sp. CF4.19 TaxID=3373082 RepID=UPI003EE6A90F
MGLLPLWTTASQWSSTVGGPGPAFYPRLLIGLLALCLVLRVAQEVKEMRQVAAGTPTPVPDDAEGEGEGPVDLRYALFALGLAALYVWGTLWIGWVIATFLAVVVFLVVAGKRNPLVIVPTALVLSVGMAYVFIKVVYIALPTGTGIFDTVTFGLLRLMGAA